MTMPAARVSDGSVHGGVIIPPGGLPSKVLIENMPAARLGDFHACPMLTGPVPHVGGPIVMGSPMVLIGNMPAARVGDLAVCTGPPDTVRPPGGAKTLIGFGSAPGPVICSVVGDPSKGYAAFPGPQGRQNSGPQAAQQIVRQATGQNHSETAMEAVAARHGYDPQAGTPVAAGPAIIREASGGAVEASLGPSGAAAAAAALEKKKAVMASTDAGLLWNDAGYVGAGHTVHVTGALVDPGGRVWGVIINDTGTGEAGRAVPAAGFDRATAGRPMTTAGPAMER